jgi:hypothetical protein
MPGATVSAGGNSTLNLAEGHLLSVTNDSFEYCSTCRPWAGNMNLTGYYVWNSTARVWCWQIQAATATAWDLKSLNSDFFGAPFCNAWTLHIQAR